MLDSANNTRVTHKSLTRLVQLYEEATSIPQLGEAVVPADPALSKLSPLMRISQRAAQSRRAWTETASGSADQPPPAAKRRVGPRTVRTNANAISIPDFTSADIATLVGQASVDHSANVHLRVLQLSTCSTTREGCVPVVDHYSIQAEVTSESKQNATYTLSFFMKAPNGQSTWSLQHKDRGQRSSRKLDSNQIAAVAAVAAGWTIWPVCWQAAASQSRTGTAIEPCVAHCGACPLVRRAH